MNRAELKRRARAQLANNIFGANWMYAVLVVLINTVIYALAGCLFGLGTVISLLLAGPISYGVAFLFLKQSRDGQRMNISELFSGFSADFGGLFLLNLMQTIFIALWSCLLLIPGIVAQISYSMSYYIKVDHPEYTWRECINASKQMMYGHKWEYFVLQLSFIGWAIVGSLCLGVGTLWVTAYAEATTAQFYEELKSLPSAV